MGSQKDGQQNRAKIVEIIRDYGEQLGNNPTLLKFNCSLNTDQFEEVIAYNDLMAYIERDNENKVLLQFKNITAHEGPLTINHPNWKGSSYIILIAWEHGELSSEPLNKIASDSPVECAIYSKHNNLLDTQGWKHFKPITKRQKNLFHATNQARICSFTSAPKFKYGFEVLHDCANGERLDNKNNNTNWQDIMELELMQLSDYQMFYDLGLHAEVPEGFKKFRVHLISDAKHDGRHKASW